MAIVDTDNLFSLKNSIVLLVLTLLLGSGVGTALYFYGQSRSGESEIADTAKSNTIIQIKPIQITMTHEDQTGGMNINAHLNVQVALGLETTDSETEVEMRRREIEDSIIYFFSEQKKSNIENPDYRKQLKKDLREILNDLLIQGKITEIFFSQYLVS